MAEALSRLHNPRRPEPKEFAAGKEAEGEHEAESRDPMHDAAEAMHKADPGSKHMIVSHDGYTAKSHGIHEDGTHEPAEGAHDHENMEALKSHMTKFFNEEENEGKQDDDGEEEPEENQSLY